MTTIVAIAAFSAGVFVPAPYDAIAKSYIKLAWNFGVEKLKTFFEKK